MGFDVVIIDQVATGGDVASSSAVRAELAQGDVRGAADMLGHWWRVKGNVISGAKRGTGMGYPTANIALAVGTTLGHGIYASTWSRWTTTRPWDSTPDPARSGRD